MKIITNSEKETFELAKNLAKKAKGGEVYALSGILVRAKRFLSAASRPALALSATSTARLSF